MTPMIPTPEDRCSLKPIAVAPRDGTKILGWERGDDCPSIIHWLTYSDEERADAGVDGCWVYSESVLSDIGITPEPEFFAYFDRPTWS